MIKKILCTLMTLIMIVTINGSCYAANDYKYIEVIRNNAPLRSNCYESAEIIGRCSTGTVLSYVEINTNIYFNKWYRVYYGDTYAWIYEENVKTHIHCYAKHEVDGIAFSICSDCGHVQFQAYPEVADYVNEKYLSASMSGALALPVIDGPAPIGDIAAIVIIAYNCLIYAGALSKTEGLIKEIPRRNVFYEVKRIKNVGLTNKTNQTLNTLQAFAKVLQGNDVWTKYQSDAYECAKLWPLGCYSEIDTPSGNPKAGYYYHYHLGKDVNHKVTTAGHIFYGNSYSTNENPKWNFGGGQSSGGGGSGAFGGGGGGGGR